MASVATGMDCELAYHGRPMAHEDQGKDALFTQADRDCLNLEKVPCVTFNFQRWRQDTNSDKSVLTIATAMSDADAESEEA